VDAAELELIRMQSDYMAGVDEIERDLKDEGFTVKGREQASKKNEELRDRVLGSTDSGLARTKFKKTSLDMQGRANIRIANQDHQNFVVARRGQEARAVEGLTTVAMSATTEREYQEAVDLIAGALLNSPVRTPLEADAAFKAAMMTIDTRKLDAALMGTTTEIRDALQQMEEGEFENLPPEESDKYKKLLVNQLSAVEQGELEVRIDADIDAGRFANARATIPEIDARQELRRDDARWISAAKATALKRKIGDAGNAHDEKGLSLFRATMRVQNKEACFARDPECKKDASLWYDTKLAQAGYAKHDPRNIDFALEHIDAVGFPPDSALNELAAGLASSSDQHLLASTVSYRKLLNVAPVYEDIIGKGVAALAIETEKLMTAHGTNHDPANPANIALAKEARAVLLPTGAEGLAERDRRERAYVDNADTYLANGIQAVEDAFDPSWRHLVADIEPNDPIATDIATLLHSYILLHGNEEAAYKHMVDTIKATHAYTNIGTKNGEWGYQKHGVRLYHPQGGDGEWITKQLAADVFKKSVGDLTQDNIDEAAKLELTIDRTTLEGPKDGYRWFIQERDEETGLPLPKTFADGEIIPTFYPDYGLTKEAEEAATIKARNDAKAAEIGKSYEGSDFKNDVAWSAMQGRVARAKAETRTDEQIEADTNRREQASRHGFGSIAGR